MRNKRKRRKLKINLMIGPTNYSIFGDKSWLTAKMKWKQKYHKERWERRYKKHYPEFKGGEIGNYNGCIFIIDTYKRGK